MSSIISLGELTGRALDAADAGESSASSFGPDSQEWSSSICRSLSVLSDSNLMSTLRVALSLADHCCDADEHNGGHQPQLPTPSTDCVERVVVHLSNEQHQSIAGCKDDFEPLPFSGQNPNWDSTELQDMLNVTFFDHSLYTGNDAEEGASTGGASELVPYHNVARAEFSPFPNEKLGSQKGEMERIYKLGIEYYMLFSGGERPPEIKPQINSAESKNKSGVNEADVDEELLRHIQFSPLDLSGRLSMFNDAGDVGGLFESSDDSRQPLDVTENNAMPRKKRATPGSCTLSTISIEPLRRKGVPVSLCNMIGNMLDSMNGDLSGDEAYSSMSDVRNDLQLMLDKPDRFLYDMDCEKLALTGLQLYEAVFDRVKQFSALQNSYRRSISGDNDCGVIVGPSGIGKTVLANRLGSVASAEGALFLKGKFDQLQQMTPFSALAAAFNEYCNQMVKEGRSKHLHQVASKLQIALGGEVRHLVKLIPNLSVILGRGTDQDEGQDCANAQARIQFLLCVFVDVISSSSGAPIILFLDDLQWSDHSTLSAINQLLMYFRNFDPNRQFFFLGTCREEGLLEQHPFGSMFAKIRQFGVHATVVMLDCLDKDTTNTVVSDLLCLSPRLTRSLSDIVYHRSQGNPLFVSQLMISLCRDGLVRLSLSRRRWEWDEEKIQSTKLPDNVADVLSSTIVRFPKKVQGALFLLSCFGARSDCVFIEALEAKLDIPLIEPLKDAVSEGFVDKLNGSYSFTHDKLQEAAYNLMEPEDRCHFHCKYGLALAHDALGEIDDDMLFTAASQINLGGAAAISVAAQALKIAHLNLTAGIKAMGMSDFSSAYSFFHHGISFLPKHHWQEHYGLSLQLFEAACKCSLVIGDTESLKIFSDQILRFAKRFEDELNTLFYNVTALAYASQLPESVKMNISVLSQLGIELPESPESEIKTRIDQTKCLLQGFTDRDLIEYKIMTDQSKIMAMNFLARLMWSLQLTNQAAVPVVTLHIIQLSIEHGMSPVSPIGFTYFGHHVATCGDIEEGCRYTNIARKLLDRIGSKEFAGDVFAMGSQLLHFVKPIQLTLELLDEGYTIAMAAGDVQGALLNRTLYCPMAFWGGTKLIICKEHFSRTIRLLEQHGHFNFLARVIQMNTNIQLLMGINDVQDANPRSNATIAQVEKILKNASHHTSVTANFQKMFIHFMFREYEDMEVFVDQFFLQEFCHWTMWIMFFPCITKTFYGGLVAFWVYRKTNDPTWAERGQNAKVAMKKWAESSQHNFQHKVYLLEAEEAFCNYDTESAQSLYEKAVSTAREHRFINDEALSNELAGYFYLAIDRVGTALKCFLRAHERYNDWGAVGKCNALFEFVQTAFDSSCIPVDSVSLSNVHGVSNDRYLRKNKRVL